MYAPLCVECRSRICEHVLPRPTNGLGPREVQLLEALSRGLSNKELAEELGLGEGTVKEYLHRLFRKLGVSSRLEAALWSLKYLKTMEVTADALLAPSPSGECAGPLEESSKG